MSAPAAVRTPVDVRELDRLAHSINPGGWAVEDARPISTLLGSCVAVCLWDPQLQLGGMNHFMLPSYGKTNTRDLDVLLCGDYSMEALMNAMLARGARKSRMQAKAFGGGNVLASLSGTNIGERNVEFAREWLAREGVTLVASDFLGTWSRRVVFDPRSGDAFCKRGETSQQVLAAEQNYRQTLAQPKKSNVELF